MNVGDAAPSRMRRTFASISREARLELRLTQAEVADAVHVSRGYVAAIEAGTANPTLDVVERVGRFLGLDAELVLRRPTLIDPSRQRDLVHAGCVGYVDRRLGTSGWQTAREVEIVQARSHGWIDLLAFHPGTETVLVIEIKTRLLDLGLVERQLGWYARAAGDAARQRGWIPRRIASWLLVLASEEVDRVITTNRQLLEAAFPLRARGMLEWLSDGRHPLTRRGLAMIDPRSKRREWLIRSRVDGRRVPCRYVDYGAAARRLGG
jgi:transcriptional regulator with XRE-family HTH domain